MSMNLLQFPGDARSQEMCPLRTENLGHSASYKEEE